MNKIDVLFTEIEEIYQSFKLFKCQFDRLTHDMAKSEKKSEVFHEKDGNINGFLTNREKEILPLLIQEMDIDEIASKLKSSPRTIQVHRDHIRKKLGFKNIKQFRRYLREKRKEQ